MATDVGEVRCSEAVRLIKPDPEGLLGHGDGARLHPYPSACVEVWALLVTSDLSESDFSDFSEPLVLTHY